MPHRKPPLTPKPDIPRLDTSRLDTSRPEIPRADNKVRLSPDVLEKAERIAAEWGLKNARAAVEAVFRKYCDDYLHGRPSPSPRSWSSVAEGGAVYGQPLSGQTVPAYGGLPATVPPCEALDALDQLLAM